MAVSISRRSQGQKWVKDLQKKLPKLATSAIALLIFLLIWQVLCFSPDAPLPSPTKVVSETWELIVNPFFNNGGTDVGLFWQIFASLQRVAVGFTLAAIVGIAAGILIGSSALIYDAIAIWPIIINTAVGVQQVPQDYKNVSRVLKLSKVEYFFNILFPATVPYVFTGLRIGIGLSWLAIVAAEMLIGGVGIGFFIWDAWNSSMISEIILALIYVGIVGFLLDRLMAYIAKLVVPEENK
jgi:nitrate/nitrite transport system permease protein